MNRQLLHLQPGQVSQVLHGLTGIQQKAQSFKHVTSVTTCGIRHLAVVYSRYMYGHTRYSLSVVSTSDL